LLPSRRRSRHHVRAGRAVRALRAALSPAPAAVVPRGRGAGPARSEGAAVSAAPNVDVRILGPGDEGHVTALLAAHADSSLFLRSNLDVGLVDRDARYHGTWAGAFEEERLVAVAQHSRFTSVLVQAPVHTAAVALAAARASGRPVGGFVG